MDYYQVSKLPECASAEEVAVAIADDAEAHMIDFTWDYEGGREEFIDWVADALEAYTARQKEGQ